MTANQVAEAVTYQELVEFCAWQEIKRGERKKWEYYLAQIAGCIVGRKRWKIADFLLEFRRRRQTKTLPKLTAKALKRAFGIKD